MAINFPDSPSVNDTVTQGDHTWIWDGTTWKLAIATAIAPAGSNTQVQYNSSGAFAGSSNLTFDGSTVSVSSGTENIGIKVTSTDANALISFADNGATAHGYAALGGQSDGLAFFAGGSQRVTVLSGGNVGIGTTTPMRKLDVDQEVLMHHGDHAWLWQSYGGDLRLWYQSTYTSGDSGWTKVLDIGPDGAVQQPLIPAFRAANTTGGAGYIYNGSVSGAGTIIWGSDSGYGLYDNGNNYNTSTGIFTAPVDGYYLFTATIFMHTSYDNDTDCYWGISSSNGIVTTNHGTKGEDGGQTASGVFYLDAGDTAKAYVNSSLDLYSWRTEQYNSFQGILLG